jgi:hypothetical protein
MTEFEEQQQYAAARQAQADALTETDMAMVGRALMNAIKVHAHDGWAPADCPSEIVGDLRCENDEMTNKLYRLQYLLHWAYGKLHDRTFSSMEDAMRLDEMKLLLEHDL